MRCDPAGAGVHDADETVAHADTAQVQRRKAAASQERADARKARAIMQRSFEGAVAAAVVGASKRRMHEGHAQYDDQGRRVFSSSAAKHRRQALRPPEDAVAAQRARDAKREAHGLLFSGQHTQDEQVPKFDSQGDLAQYATSGMHAARRQSPAAQLSISPRGKHGASLSPRRGGRVQSAHDEITSEGYKSPHGAGMVGPYAVGGMDTETVEQDNEMKLRRKERDARLGQMFGCAFPPSKAPRSEVIEQYPV